MRSIQTNKQTTVLTARVPAKLGKELDNLAQAVSRPKSWLINSALQAYVHENSWQIKAIEKGIEDIEKGNVVDGDDVESWLKSWGTRTPKKAPK